MKRGSIILLQVIVVLIGMVVLAFMLWEPHLEGRNVDATVYEIYFKDPFLACAYIASIPFFVGLYQTFKILQFAGQNNIFSHGTVRALRIIRYCAVAIVSSVVAGEAYLFVFQRSKDDIAGGVFMGLLIIFCSGVVAIVAKMFERILQNAVDIKSENDLTV